MVLEDLTTIDQHEYANGHGAWRMPKGFPFYGELRTGITEAAEKCQVVGQALPKITSSLNVSECREWKFSAWGYRTFGLISKNSQSL